MEKIIIYGALANVNIENGNKLLADFFAKNTNDIEIRFYNYGPGVKSAFDWELILKSTASLVSIAGFIWNAYDKIVAPKKKKDSGIVIQIRGENEKIETFFIGKEYTDKKIFIESFTRKIKNFDRDLNLIKFESEQTTNVKIE